MNLTEQQLTRINHILKLRPVLKAYVFGSYARNEADSNSDLDILVDLDYTQHIGLDFVRMQTQLEAQLHIKVDLVSSGGLSKHLKSYIDREKQVIYTRA